MVNYILFKVLVPFSALITGAIIAYWSNRFLWLKHSKSQRSIELFEEFHSSDMLKFRIEAVKILKDNPERNIEYLYQNLPDDLYLPLSRVFHFIEKVGVYERNNQIDTYILKELLGRYFDDWHKLYYKRLTRDLPQDSEFTDMMSKLEYVAKKMGKQSQVRH